MDKNYTLEDLGQVLDKIPFLAWINDEEGELIYGNTSYCNHFSTLDPSNQVIKLNGREFFTRWKHQYNTEGKIIKSYGLGKGVDKYAFFNEFLAENYYLPDELKETKNIPLDLNEGLVEIEPLLTQMLAQSKAEMVAIFLEREEGGEQLKLQFLDAIDRGCIRDLDRNHLEINKGSLLREEESYGVFLEENQLDKPLGELVHQFHMKGIKIYPILFNHTEIGFITLLYNHNEGDEKYIDMIMVGFIYYLGVIIRYIINYKQVERTILERQEAEKELDLFSNHMQQLIIFMDTKGKVVRVGDYWKSLLGWTKSELKEKGLENWMHPSCIERFHEIREALLEDNTHVYMQEGFSLITIEGTYKQVSCYIRYSKELEQFMIIGRDISNLHKAEEEYLDLQKYTALEHVREDFLRHTIQELKRPIDTLSKNITTIKESIDQHQEVENRGVWVRYVNMIEQNERRLERLINNLIDSGKIERKEYKLHKVYCDVVKLIDYIVQVVRSYVESKGLSISLETTVEKAIMYCDINEIQRAMLNLISNGIKYTGEEGQITIKIDKKEKNLQIKVIDTGEGIPPEKVDKIFESFVRGYNSLTRRKEGAGIGLALVKGIIELHHGKISVESQLKKETCFTIEIPFVTEPIKANRTVQEISIATIKNWEMEFADI